MSANATHLTINPSLIPPVGILVDPNADVVEALHMLRAKRVETSGVMPQMRDKRTHRPIGAKTGARTRSVTKRRHQLLPRRRDASVDLTAV